MRGPRYWIGYYTANFSSHINGPFDRFKMLKLVLLTMKLQHITAQRKYKHKNKHSMSLMENSWDRIMTKF